MQFQVAIICLYMEKSVISRTNGMKLMISNELNLQLPSTQVTQIAPYLSLIDQLVMKREIKRILTASVYTSMLMEALSGDRAVL